MNIRVWDKVFREYWDDSLIKHNYKCLPTYMIKAVMKYMKVIF